MLPLSPLKLFSLFTPLSPFALPPLVPLYDQWIVVGAIGANVATLTIGHFWCHQLLMDILTFASPQNGVNGAILFNLLITSGNRHWSQWWLSLTPMAMGCAIGAIWSITIGANGSAVTQLFVAICANGTNGENSKSLWHFYPKQFCTYEIIGYMELIYSRIN